MNFRLTKYVINIRVIKFLRIFEFHNLHLVRGGLMLANSISEEKWKNGKSTSWSILVQAAQEQPAPEWPGL